MSEVRDRPDHQRYELTVGSGTAFAAYRREGDRIIFTHTVVPDDLRGNGLGTRLVAAAVADARGQGLTIVPDCPFVAAYVQRHPDAAQG